MTLSARVLTALAIAYPFVSHFGATLGAPVVPLLWLCLMFWGSLPSRSRSPFLISLALACPVAAVIEYPIRRRVLRDLERTPFIDSLRGSLRLDLR